MQRLYESASAIGCQECTTKLINMLYIHFALFCGNFVRKLNHRKKGEIFHLFKRVRDLDYVVNKLAARWVKLSAEARTLVADCNVLLLHSKDVSSYIDPQSNLTKMAGNFSFCNRSGCFRQQTEEPYEFVKGGSGFRKALKLAPDPWHFLFFHVRCKIWSVRVQWTSWRKAISLKVRGFSGPFYNSNNFLNLSIPALESTCWLSHPLLLVLFIVLIKRIRVADCVNKL